MDTLGLRRTRAMNEPHPMTRWHSELWLGPHYMAPILCCRSPNVAGRSLSMASSQSPTIGEDPLCTSCPLWLAYLTDPHLPLCPHYSAGSISTLNNALAIVANGSAPCGGKVVFTAATKGLSFPLIAQYTLPANAKRKSPSVSPDHSGHHGLHDVYSMHA
jgi:hypothetical protein